MTKLIEWLSVLSALGAVWISLITGFVRLPLVDKWMSFIVISPLVFLVLFGLYAITVVLYRVFTFNNCDEAAKELQKEMKEAKEYFATKGMTLK